MSVGFHFPADKSMPQGEYVGLAVETDPVSSMTLPFSLASAALASLTASLTNFSAVAFTSGFPRAGGSSDAAAGKVSRASASVARSFRQMSRIGIVLLFACSFRRHPTREYPPSSKAREGQ